MPEPTKEMQEIYEDEIDLRDYIDVIIKRKKIILTVFFAAVIAATIVNFLTPKVYEASAIVRLGGTPELLISKPNAIEELQGRKLVDSVLKRLKLNNNTGEFDKNKILRIEDIVNTDFIRIIVRYRDPILATAISNIITDTFVTEKKEIFKVNLLFLNEQIKEFEKRYQIIVGEIDNFNKEISNQSMNPNYPLLQNTITNYETICFALREKAFSLKDVVLKSQDFEVFELASIPRVAIKPNKKQNVALSGIVSLMFGTFLAFFIEFWQKGKEGKVKQ